nr:hypothetical protein [Erysiphe lesion-associated ormycovirus 1]
MDYLSKADPSSADNTPSVNRTSLVRPNEGPVQESRVATFISNVVANISTRPAPYGKMQQDNTRLEPWFIQEEGSSITVTVPSDVESFADDPAVVSCLAAIELLKAKITLGLPIGKSPTLWQRCHKDVDLYYYGIAALLKEGQVGVYHNYSGWFGKGYNLAARRRLVVEGIKPWSIRGSTVPLRKVWSHKDWGTTLPAGYKHMEVLIRQAADKLNLNKELAPQWMVSLATLKTTRIKKTLTSEKVGFLLQPDVDAFAIRFKEELAHFHELDQTLSKPTMGLFVELEDKISSANKAVKSMEALSTKIIDTRAKLLYPSEKGRKKPKKKVTLKEKLASVDPVLFVNRFGPYDACGIAPFTTSEEAAFKEDGTLKIESLTQEFDRYTARNSKWEDVLRSYWNTEFLVRYG